MKARIDIIRERFKVPVFYIDFPHISVVCTRVINCVKIKPTFNSSMEEAGRSKQETY